jgi:hypothetical protein
MLSFYIFLLPTRTVLPSIAVNTCMGTGDVYQLALLFAHVRREDVLLISAFLSWTRKGSREKFHNTQIQTESVQTLC